MSGAQRADEFLFFCIFGSVFMIVCITAPYRSQSSVDLVTHGCCFRWYFQKIRQFACPNDLL